MRTPEQALMEHFGAPTGDGFKDWVAGTDAVEGLDGLSERERSRARLIRVFNIATIEALNREIEHGAPVHEALFDLAFVMGMAAAGVALQASDPTSRHSIRKQMARVYGEGFKEYVRRNARYGSRR